MKTEDHARALLVKFLILAAVSIIFLPLLGSVTFGQAILTAVVLMVVAYLVGDLGILPAAGNPAATLADIGVAMVVFWLMPFILPGMSIGWMGIIVTALIVGAGEYFFHGYLARLGEGAAQPAAGEPDKEGPS